MATVTVNSPKTPVTQGSSTVATATVPNVCKMPGPPAPFVPTPLPNTGRSSASPRGYSTSVKIEGHPVAIRGASFTSMGDIASKGTGGGVASSNVEGQTKFIGPGSFDVKIQGKNVQLLSDPMMNNCGPSGSPPNAATLGGAIHQGGKKDGTPGNNQAQNKQYRDALREAERRLGRKLDGREKDRVHIAISKQNYGYHEIVEIAVDMFS